MYLATLLKDTFPINFANFFRTPVKHLLIAASVYCQANINLEKNFLVRDWWLIHLIQLRHQHKNKRDTFDSFSVQNKSCWFLTTHSYVPGRILIPVYRCEHPHTDAFKKIRSPLLRYTFFSSFPRYIFVGSFNFFFIIFYGYLTIHSHQTFSTLTPIICLAAVYLEKYNKNVPNCLILVNVCRKLQVNSGWLISQFCR